MALASRLVARRRGARRSYRTLSGPGPVNPALPDAPILSGTAGDSSNSLSWTVPVPGDSPITGYRLRRAATQIGGDLPTTPTTYDDTTVTNGTPYTYRVTAVSALGEGPQSNAVILTPVASSLPSLAADVTTPTPTAKMVAWGSWKLANCVVTDCQMWKNTLGFGGFIGTLGGTGRLNGYGETQRFKVSSGTTVVSPVGEASPGPYDWQRAFMSLGVPSINGGTLDAPLTGGGGVGPFKAKQSDPSIYCGLSIRFATGTNPSGGPMGDVFDTTIRADVAAQLANLAAGIKYLGGDVLGLDLEEGQWFEGIGAPGHTQAQTNAAFEALGYACFMAVYAAAPSIDLMVYTTHWEGGYYEAVTSTKNNATDNRVQFQFGAMRAHRDSNATGKHIFIDADLGYRDTTVARCKLNTQGILAKISTTLDPTVWTRIAPDLYISLFSWAGTDGSPFYSPPNQPGQPTYTDWLEIHRKYGMAGLRAEFTRFGHPGRNSTEGGEGQYVGGNNYLTAVGRPAGMVAAASTSGAYSTLPPVITMTAAPVRSGGNVTFQFNMAAAEGIHRGFYKVYAPNGSVVGTGNFRMTHDPNGGSINTNFNNSRQLVNESISAPVGGTVDITAFSVGEQQHSVRVSV